MSEIDTNKSQRRTLRFETIDDLLAEIDRLVAAEREGRLRCTGNWTLGQACGHLASWVDYAYDGYPFRVPWFIRMFLQLKVKRYLRDGLPVGVRIPKVKAGTYAVDPLSIDEGVARLRHALARLQSDAPAPYDSPAFGPLSDADRAALNTRHAELHLGFFHTG